MNIAKQAKALKKARNRERKATMKALAITFLALLGGPMLVLAGCATQSGDLDSGWGYFQQVGGVDSARRYSENGESFVIWSDDISPFVFKTGNHVKTLHLCDSADAIRLNQDSYLKLKYHWDAKYSCDAVDDIEVQPRPFNGITISGAVFATDGSTNIVITR